MLKFLILNFGSQAQNGKVKILMKEFVKSNFSLDNKKNIVKSLNIKFFFNLKWKFFL